MAILVIVLCVAIFACVASTLAWDSQGVMAGYGGYGTYGGSYGTMGGGYNSFGGGAYGAGNNYGYGSLGGNYNDPRSGKAFMIVMAIIVGIFVLVVFIITVSHKSLSESRKFYLAVVIICAILALFMLIATIVYLMAVNPMAQSTGSIYGNQIAGLCAQYQQPQLSGVFVNQYLYHYCVVEPQEVSMHIQLCLRSSVSRSWLISFSFISGHRYRVRLPGDRRSDYHARFRTQDSSENSKLWQEQHFLEEIEACRWHWTTSGDLSGSMGKSLKAVWVKNVQINDLNSTKDELITLWLWQKIVPCRGFRVLNPLVWMFRCC